MRCEKEVSPGIPLRGRAGGEYVCDDCDELYLSYKEKTVQEVNEL